MSSDGEVEIENVSGAPILPKEVTDEKADGRLLDWLVFDALRCDPGTAHVRDLVSFHGGGLVDHERTEEAQAGRQAARPGGRREPDAADLVEVRHTLHQIVNVKGD